MCSKRSTHRASLYFGLGAVTKVDKLEVKWPEGSAKTFDVPVVDKTLTLRQSKDSAAK